MGSSQAILYFLVYPNYEQVSWNIRDCHLYSPRARRVLLMFFRAKCAASCFYRGHVSEMQIWNSYKPKGDNIDL